MPLITYREALNQALREEMRRDEHVFLMGEEVGFYQGAYKVSKGLLEEFGADRVLDTPITELGFTGLAVGAAMAGLRPVVEMMTFNFSLLALDQIVNSAAKMLYMSGGQSSVPMVIRGPGGSAHQLAAQHSQALEAWFCHVPGLKVVMPSTPADAKGLLKSAVRDNNTVIFIESETLYGTRGEVPEGDYVIPLGVAEIKRPGRDVTVIAHSKMVLVALDAARELQMEGIEVEVIDLLNQVGADLNDRRDRGGGLAVLRGGRADGGYDSASRLRLPRRPHPARDGSGRADALREKSRTFVPAG